MLHAQSKDTAQPYILTGRFNFRGRMGYRPVTGNDTEHVVGDVVEHRTSYYISFFFVLLTFLFHFLIKFDQILVFDVMLQTVSSTRRVAASPPSPPQLHAHRTYNSCLDVTLRIASCLILKGAGWSRRARTRYLFGLGPHLPRRGICNLYL
jgi:hypothetical protein